jgi:hypothetical protein
MNVTRREAIFASASTMPKRNSRRTGWLREGFRRVRRDFAHLAAGFY